MYEFLCWVAKMRQIIYSIDTGGVIFYKFSRNILYSIDNHSIIKRRNTPEIEQIILKTTKKKVGNRREGKFLKCVFKDC